MLNEIAVLDDREWAERANFWSEEIRSKSISHRRRQRNSTPLILTGHGTSLRIENDALVIREGFTHFPQEQTARRYFKGALDIPQRILLLDGSGTLSFDVLSWLAQQSTTLIRIKWTGEIAVVSSGTDFAADREKVRWQIAARADEKMRVAFARNLILTKFANSITTLQNNVPASKWRDQAVRTTLSGKQRISQSSISSVDEIRAIEGECAAAYFSAWRQIAVNWKGTERRPIPNEWRTFLSRSSAATGVKPKNHSASHPLNAMLNYAYTVKMGQVKIAVLAGGYDPMLGVMHHTARNKSAFVFDLIEPERPKVDAAILAFVAGHKFSAADFVIRAEGVCRLSPQLAKAIAQCVELPLRLNVKVPSGLEVSREP